jgi:copper(I)-binding protein
MPAAGLALAMTAAAHADPAVSIEAARIAPPPPSARVAAAFFTVRNKADAPDRLVSAACACAERVELHEMRMNGAVMTMGPLRDGLAVPAHGHAQLGPHGAHVMLIGLTRPMVANDVVALTLRFERAGAITNDAQVAMSPR